MAGTGGAGDGTDDKAAPANTAASAKANTPSADAPAKPAASSLENELQQLRDLIVSQSKELEATRQQMKEQQEKMDALENELKAGTAANAALGSTASSAPGGLAASPASTSSIGTTTPTTVANGGKAGQVSSDEPLSIKFKGITLTPGGFLAAEGVWRQKALVADVNSPFNSIPFPGSSQSQLSELNFSARQSRLSLLAEGKLDNVALRGYYEVDWLGAGVTSNNNQSNSYVLRQRQIWGQAAFSNGFTITGGQMWSLLTEYRHGLENRSEAIPLTIDAQYNVGFTWARQFGVRITKNWGDKFWLGLAIEDPETTFGGVNPLKNTLIAAPGTLGGLLSNQANYSFNTTPDFVFKAALEPGWGHYEVFGVVGSSRTRVFPCADANLFVACPANGLFAASAAGAFNNSTTIGGFGVNARAPLFSKHLDAGFHFFGNDGYGRYGAGGLANTASRPVGTIGAIRNYQSLASLEWHFNPKLDIYAYVGGEYDSRTAYSAFVTTVSAPTTPPTPPAPVVTLTGFGYGSPLASNKGCLTETLPTNQNTPGAVGGCQGDTKDMIEATLGFWYRFYKGTKGTVQWGPQYSYISRVAWPGFTSGTTAAPLTFGAPHEVENMVFMSFRYYLP
jgi:hypothetical protein